MQFGPESLLPPLVAIVLAIITRKVVPPLAFGVFVGAFLLARQNAADLSFYDFVPLVEFSQADRASQMIETAWWHAPLVFLKSMKESIDSKSHLQALAFSLLFGAMVGVLEAGGGMRSLIQRLSQKIKSRRGAQTMIATSGLAIFFDDYANTLLLGGTMRSTADRYRISREKLAYLVDSTAAPVAGLSVVSTWAAIEISYMGEGLKAAGIEDTSAAFQMFIQSIPFRFYPWLALAMVFTVSISGRDFGPMHRAESKADSDGEHRGGESSARQSENDWLWIAAVLPVVLCVASVGVVLTITGLQSIDAHDSTIGLLRFAGEVLGNGDSYVALIVGGAVGLMVAVASHLLLGGCDLPVAIRAALKGAKHMTPALLILWFAWALSAMTEPNRLDTGGYLAGVLSNRLDSGLLPTVVFLIAAAMAFSTGTSWGTMAILTPLSISLALQLDPDGGPGGAVALATCGSVLAGAIFGDHCSPISDTTVLSSRASGCDHVAHVRTQLPYALIVAAICVLVGTLPSAVGFSPWLCLLLGLACIFVIVGWWGKQSCETKNFV